MATTTLRSLPGSAGLLWLLLLVPLAAAAQFRVGGSMGWAVPTDTIAMSYSQWAERSRFQIGDSLLFVYPPDKDSVLQVTKEDYINCNTANFIARFDDGNTVFTFNQSGPLYFISGVHDNCLKKESLVAVVMADRSNRSSSGSNPPGSASPPSPAPASSSSSSSPPSPPPASSSSSPPPPPASVGGIVPSSPPPPPNAASSLKVVGVMGSVGAFLGSCILVVL